LKGGAESQMYFLAGLKQPSLNHSFLCCLSLKSTFPSEISLGMGVDDRTRDIELSTIAVRNENDQDLETLNVFGRAEDGEVFSLPPADGGKDAWLFLASCVIFEAVSWGEFVMIFAQVWFSDNIFEDFLSVLVSSSHTTSNTLQTMVPALQPLVRQRRV
jgi:hypothetical protein